MKTESVVESFDTDVCRIIQKDFSLTGESYNRELQKQARGGGRRHNPTIRSLCTETLPCGDLGPHPPTLATHLNYSNLAERGAHLLSSSAPSGDSSAHVWRSASEREKRFPFRAQVEMSRRGLNSLRPVTERSGLMADGSVTACRVNVELWRWRVRRGVLWTREPRPFFLYFQETVFLFFHPDTMRRFFKTLVGIYNMLKHEVENIVNDIVSEEDRVVKGKT